MKQLSRDYVGYILEESTLQEADLIESALRFLADVAKKCQVVRHVNALCVEVDALKKYDVAYAFWGYRFAEDDPDEHGQTSAEKATYIWYEDMLDLLNNIAPIGCYFGPSDGDGACFGFWPFCQECGMQTEWVTKMCDYCKETR